ncbi:MAG: imidazole glycerol phosphate synthase cyclase subunit [Deltaproteobacteria bacterium RBG_13_60_28]|nr:MAG: imidazole glycerol phosphate synthase cyclase subunit [Deltaproteobacteria bacterium RBG_13_60_28]
MLKKRLIPVLILRDGLVVQSIQFKHTNVIHWKPVTAVDFFNRWAVDEIVVLDVSRNGNQRSKFYEVIVGLSEKCFVPLTVGGWVDSVDEVRKLLRLGADKITINTEAVRRPPFITECAQVFGSQCIVVSIDVQDHGDGKYEVCIDRGQEPTGLSPIDWARQAQEMGAGEIFLNCIDRDGFRQGYDLVLLKTLVDAVNIPVIAMGGVLTWQHLADGIIQGGAEAVAAANIFHYTEHSTRKAKQYLREAGIDVR